MTLPHPSDRSPAFKAFAEALAQAMTDGRIDESEARELESLARRANATLPELVAAEFSDKILSDLTRAFSDSIYDGKLDKTEWRSLLETSRTLGLSIAELRAAIAQPAMDFLKKMAAVAHRRSESKPQMRARFKSFAQELTGDPDCADNLLASIEHGAADSPTLPNLLVRRADTQWRTHLLGGVRIHYLCPQCKSQLRSKPAALQTGECCSHCGATIGFDQDLANPSPVTITYPLATFLDNHISLQNASFTCPRCKAALQSTPERILSGGSCDQCGLAVVFDAPLQQAAHNMLSSARKALGVPSEASQQALDLACAPAWKYITGTTVARAYHPVNGASEAVRDGFSWPCLLFGFFWFVYKGMWRWALLSFAASLVTCGLSWVVFPFFANGLYAHHLRTQGWLTEKQWRERDARHSVSRLPPPDCPRTGTAADEIMKLASLKEQGALSEQEFVELKARIINVGDK